MSETALTALAERSTFVFAGAVVAQDRSSLRGLPSRQGLVVVRFERGFRVNPVLGKLEGRPITVRLSPQAGSGVSLRAGQRAVFFATAWVHADEIAVTELARLPADDKTEQEVAHAVAQLPQLHLSRRIASAVLVVHGTATEIERAADIARTPTEHDPFWMRALIEVRETLKGQGAAPAARGRRSVGTAILLFPGTRDIAFRNAPRPSKGQEAVFLLHEASGEVAKFGHVAPDPADIQPPSALPTIRRLLGAPPAGQPPG